MEEEINLLEYYYIIKKKFWFLFGLVLVFNLLVLGVLYLWPKTYTSKAILLPVSSEKPSQLSALAALGGLSGLMDQGSKTLTQLTIFLESRSLAQRVIEKGNFRDKIIEVQKIKQNKDPLRLEDLAEIMSANLIVVQVDSKKGVVQFQTNTRDPQFSYDLMNTYLMELKDFIRDNRLTSARRNREFIGLQLIEVQKELLEAGKNISNYYSQYKISSSSSRIDVEVFLPLNEGAKVEGSSPADFSMDQRKELIESLMKKKDEVKEKIGQVIVKDVPQQNYLEYLTIQKTLLTKLQMMLAEQYEIAKLEEAKDSLTFQIVDGPIFTKNPSKPNKKIILLVSCLASFMLGLFIVLFRHYLNEAKASFIGKSKTVVL